MTPKTIEGLERRISNPARGFRKGVNLRLVVSFDDETFDEIRGRAVKSGRSMSAEIRDLVEWGLEAESAPDMEV